MVKCKLQNGKQRKHYENTRNCTISKKKNHTIKLANTASQSSDPLEGLKGRVAQQDGFDHNSKFFQMQAVPNFNGDGIRSANTATTVSASSGPAIHPDCPHDEVAQTFMAASMGLA